MLARVFRSKCSQCGSVDLEWMTAAQATRAGLLVAEAAEMVGVVESCWRCLMCGHCGFFGPTEVG